MCIAIYKPAGAWASKEYLRNSFKANPDGAGFAFHDGNRVRIVKGFFTWRAFWRAYKHYVKTENEALVHFRITTKGSSSIDNCHPYDLGNGALMHNGPCLNYKYCNGDKSTDRSDSRQFAEDFISGMDSWQVERIKPMIESFIGTEKVVMMFDDETTIICGEDHGVWADGCWWSNYSFRGYGSRFGSLTTYSKYGLADYDYVDAYDTPPLTHVPRTIANSPEGPRVTLPGATSTVPTVAAIWSTKLKEYVPARLSFNGETHIWNELFCAYTPLTLSNDATHDKEVVYDIDKDGEWDIVAEVIQSVDHLRMVLADADEFTATPSTANSKASEAPPVASTGVVVH